MRRALTAALFAVLVAAAPARAVAPGPAGEIAYLCNPPTPAQLCAVAPDGSGRRLVRSYAQYMESPDAPAWSSDGRLLSFWHGGVAIVKPDGSAAADDPSSVPDAAGRAAWSPDDKWLVVSGGPDIDSGVSHLYKVHPDGSGLTDLTPGLTGYAIDPEWSPDGARIAFDNGRELQTVPAGGGPITQLTTSPPDQYARDPSWSPDGTTMLFTRGSDLDDSTHIAAVDASGSGEHAVTTGTTDAEPAWSPDGRSFVFSRNSGGLYVAAADGSGAHQIAGPPNAAAFSPSWGTHPPGSTPSGSHHRPKVRITRLHFAPKHFWIRPDGWIGGYGPFDTRFIFHLSRRTAAVAVRVASCLRLRHGRCRRAGHVWETSTYNPVARGLNDFDYDGSYGFTRAGRTKFLRRGAYRFSLWPVAVSGDRLRRAGPTRHATFFVTGHCRHQRQSACFRRPA